MCGPPSPGGGAATVGSALVARRIATRAAAGGLRLVAAIHAPDATQTILECLDLPSHAPPMAAPQLDDAEGCGAGDIGARF